MSFNSVMSMPSFIKICRVFQKAIETDKQTYPGGKSHAAEGLRVQRTAVRRGDGCG